MAAASDEWSRWADELEGFYVAMLTIGHLFVSRDVEVTLGALRVGVERFTQRPFDESTVRVLCSVHGEGLQMHGSGDALVIKLSCFTANGDGNAPSKKRTRAGKPPAKSPTTVMQQRRPFAAKPTRVGALPPLIAAEKVKLREAISRYVTRHGASGSGPPLLHAPAVAAASTAATTASTAVTTAADAAGPSTALAVSADERPWSDGDAVDASNLCSFMRQQPGYRHQIVHCAVTPPRTGHVVPLASLPAGGTICPAIHKALAERGIPSLYSHQQEALDASGHVIVATSTSSGKSLVYSIPAVQAVIADQNARSLLLFPTKALAHDQLGSLRSLADAACPSLYAATLDGDTPRVDRAQLAARAHVLLANPDILHATVLPRHAEWSDLLRNLKVIAVDEAHAYHGTFGSHVALVLRRLRRLCHWYGSSPRIVCCSATIANPREHMANLTGISAGEITLVAADGSPAGLKTLCLWNPPRVNPSALINWHEKLPPGAVRRRTSTLAEASRLLSKMLEHNLRTIAFVRTRAVAERLFERTRELLRPELRPKLASYRAGYLKEERREIERRLFGGELMGVIATTALELGVDVGGLDASIHVGYPGSTASLAQQAGRAGRGGRDAVAVLIGADNPLEQHLMDNPHALISRNLEQTVINPTNPVVLRAHLRAAAHEAPLRLPGCLPVGALESALSSVAAAEDSEAGGGGESDGAEPEPFLGLWEDWRAAAQAALSAGELRMEDRVLHAVGTPQSAISLRDIDSHRVRLVVVPPQGREFDLETMDEKMAQLSVYTGAVFLHAGASYVVTELDWGAHIARLKREDTAYYTEPRDHTRVTIQHRYDPIDVFGAPAYVGPMRISKHVYGYREMRKSDGQLQDMCDLEQPLPPMEWETRGVWLELPSALRDALKERDEDYARGALHAIEHLAIGLAPLCVTCEPCDLACQCTRREGDEHSERLLIFERRRGGVGVADALQTQMPRLLQAAQSRIEGCDCEEGCLACIHMSGCGEYNEGLDKQGAITVLRWLISGEIPTAPDQKSPESKAQAIEGCVKCTDASE